MIDEDKVGTFFRQSTYYFILNYIVSDLFNFFFAKVARDVALTGFYIKIPPMFHIRYVFSYLDSERCSTMT